MSTAASEPEKDHAEPSKDTPSQTTVDLRTQLCDKNLFVFYLPAHWNENDLKAEFGKFGEIYSAKVIKRVDLSSKGYGFVCFTESSSAAQALEAMDGRSFSGKRLKVSFKKTPEECIHSQVMKLIEMSSTPNTDERQQNQTLFVFHLPSNWEDDDLYQNFKELGDLVNAKIVKRQDGSSRGYGFVTYADPKAAALAITNMNGFVIGNKKRLKVQLKQQMNSHQSSTNATINVYNYPFAWNKHHLERYFEVYGFIVSVEILKEPYGHGERYASITYKRHQSAFKAVAGMNGSLVGNKRLFVTLKNAPFGPPFRHRPFIDMNYMTHPEQNKIEKFAPNYPHMPIGAHEMAPIATQMPRTARSSFYTYQNPAMNPAFDIHPHSIPPMPSFHAEVASYNYPNAYPSYFQRHA